MQTAAYENQRADGPNAGERAKPSTAAINQATPPAINNSKVTRKKYPGCVARSCCSINRSGKNISLESLLREQLIQTFCSKVSYSHPALAGFWFKQKASAVCAREPLWFVHKR